MNFNEISRGNIFFFSFLFTFILLLISLFIFKSSIVGDFKDKIKASNKSSVLTFIYLLSFFQYLFTPFPVRSRSFLDDTLMSKSGILPTSAVISIFLALIVFLMNYIKLNIEERSNESKLQMLFATLPLGPTAFLFGNEYKTLVNEIYYKKDNSQQKPVPINTEENVPVNQ